MSNTPITPGSGAAVATDELATNLTGTVAKNGTTTLTGTGTAFTTQLAVGQVIRVPGTATEDRIVAAIASDTSLTVSVAFAQSASGQTAQRITQAQQIKLLDGTAGSTTPIAAGQATMSGSLPVAIASDQSAITANPSTTTGSGTITASTQTVSVAVGGHATVGFGFSGTFTGFTVTVERSVDGGTNWLPALYQRATSSSMTTVLASVTSLAITAGQQIFVDALASTHIRVRCVALSTGTVNVATVASAAPPSPITSLIDPSTGTLDVNLNFLGGTFLSRGQTTMANSLPVVVASDQGSFPVAPASISTSGTITANGQSVSLALAGRNAVAFSFSGTFSGISGNFQVSTDGGTTWIAVNANYSNSVSSSFNWNPAGGALAVGAGYQVNINAAGCTHARFNATAYTSGTATVAIVASYGGGTSLMTPWVSLAGTQYITPMFSNGANLSGSYPSDAYAAGNVAIFGSALGQVYNEGTIDRVRGNTTLTILSSSAQTTTQSSADQTNYNHRGVIAYLNVTVASGTGGLTLKFQGKDSISAGYYTIYSASAAVTATGLVAYALYPSTMGGFTGSVNAILPRTWRIQISAGDASSYTYSVSAAMVL